MASMNLLEQHTTTTHHHQTRFGLFCFDLTPSTHAATTLNLSPFPIYQEPFNNHHHLSTQQDWKENNYINQNLQLETSCNNNNNVDNNHHHHHQQPKLENFLGGHSFADHHHDYGANSSGDYLFQNCSQSEVTAGGGEGSAGGSGGSTNSIHHQHMLVNEVVKLKRIKRGLKFVERGIEIKAMEVFEIWEGREEGLKIMVGIAKHKSH
ncbi:hypothetical protein Ahy_B06g085549 [Arachis hypogaea]|uniref:Uncharacterized protein n=1 Tax=Arachis hypogaea TaxID=3818 RepID=A0A444YUZ2_ARAHY|nr:hypothetical protein Ahy_B06g085549 [Arachis hypogaea]